KSKAPSRAGTSKATPSVCWRGWPLLLLLLLALLRVVSVVSAARVIDGLAFDFPALCGALNLCCKEEKGRETV
ncbi:hypothetical protein, partial [Ralstonia mannitolilytica]|uniref:hypothetical protein n=1 Tax=Ralstonia mannitolilytica TaxID=105219 RepID=UPI002930A035